MNLADWVLCVVAAMAAAYILPRMATAAFYESKLHYERARDEQRTKQAP